MQPHRTVLGSLDPAAAEKVAQLHLPLRAPIVITDLRTAEMIKYASNAFLATKISFINEIANICEELGADVKEVAVGMGYDKRIGPFFLDAGLGYGGSCFPKDVKALAYMAEEKGRHPQLLHAVMEINDDRRPVAVHRIQELLSDLNGKKVGLLGLSFKPNTDDMREAPSIDIARGLIENGAQVVAYDPVAMDVASEIMPEIVMVEDPYRLAEGADAIIVVTEWNEFQQLDLNRIRDLARRNRPEVPIEDRHRVSARTPYEECVAREMAESYERALERLANDEREAVIMRIELHYDYTRIAEELDRPNAAAARAFVNRTLVKLARMMQVSRD